MRHKRGTLTDYPWCSNAHDVTTFGEKQVQFFDRAWTVAALLCFGVVEKQKHVKWRRITVLHAYHFNHKDFRF